MADKRKVVAGSIEEKILNDMWPRRVAMDMYPGVFKDPGIIDLYNKFDYTPNVKKVSKGEAIRAAVTQYDIIQAVKGYLLDHPEACVVNMGCGFDTTFPLCDNGTCQWYNVDFLDVMLLRKQIVGKAERENSIAADITEHKWLDKIEKFDKDKGIVFYASNLFHFFKREDVHALIGQIANKFRGALIVMDVYSSTELKRYLKTKLSEEEMKDIGFYFSAEQEAQVRKWSLAIENIVERGLYTGYLTADQLGQIDMLTRMAMKSYDKNKDTKIYLVKIAYRFLQ